MKRVLGSSLVALALTLCVVLPAQAAEIPPTPACEATLKESFEQFAVAAIIGKPTNKQEALAERTLFEGFAAAGCVSDAKPLYRDMRPMPYTEQCIASLGEAQAFLGPKSAKLRSLVRPFIRKVMKPFAKRFRILNKRLFSSERKDNRRQTARINRKLDRVLHAYLARIRALTKTTEPIWADDASGIVVTWFELVSLRCLPSELYLDRSARNPGQRFANRNLSVIVNAVVYGWSREFPGKSSAGATSSRIESSASFDRPQVAGSLPFFLTD